MSPTGMRFVYPPIQPAGLMRLNGGHKDMRRSGKFYSRNEKETLRALGLTPAPLSGAGWVTKEDGENETTMVQLKSTDAQSYRLGMQDMKELEYHAMVSNKVPIFLVQFLKQDKIYAIVDINFIEELHQALDLGKRPDNIVVAPTTEAVGRKKVTSSKKAREEFFKERDEKFAKRK